MKRIFNGIILLIVGLLLLNPTESVEKFKELKDGSLFESMKETAKSITTSFIKVDLKKKEVDKSKFKRGTVIRVVDGDTIHVKLDDGEILNVRMIGVDTPESVHPEKEVEHFGNEASDYTKSMLRDRVVYLQKDESNKDKYGRYLRYVWLGLPETTSKDEIVSKMFNAKLVKEGYAHAKFFPPDTTHKIFFKKLEEKAINNKAGLWSESL